MFNLPLIPCREYFSCHILWSESSGVPFGYLKIYFTSLFNLIDTNPSFSNFWMSLSTNSIVCVISGLFQLTYDELCFPSFSHVWWHMIKCLPLWVLPVAAALCILSCKFSFLFSWKQLTYLKVLWFLWVFFLKFVKIGLGSGLGWGLCISVQRPFFGYY